MRRHWTVLPLAGLLLATGCTRRPAVINAGESPPRLAAFLTLPVATPTACPSAPGATAGRESPWVGHIDISVFIDPHAGAAAVSRLGAALRALPRVRGVYFESKAEAYAEFQRLYSCSGVIKPGALPASYRIALAPVTLAQRDGIVRLITPLAAVTDVSCAPAHPCSGGS
jgi:hypothetical protein